MDVRAEINALDIAIGEFGPSSLKEALAYVGSPALIQDGLCMGPVAFSLLGAGLIFLTTIVGVGTFIVIRPKKDRKL